MNAALQPLWQVFGGCIHGRRSQRTKLRDNVTSSKISPPVWTLYPRESTNPVKASPKQPPTVPDDISTSRSQVLNNYELTEQVLLQMELGDLVKATAVCSRWHNIIITSKMLRTRLLDDPIPKSALVRTLERIPEPTFCRVIKKYNTDNGDHWFFRIEPSSLYQPKTKCAVIVYRTPAVHIELLVHQDQPTVIFLDPKRTRLFGVFAESIWRIDGYDTKGNIAWKDLCGVFTNPSAPFCAYLWKYLVTDREGAVILARSQAAWSQNHILKGTVNSLMADDAALWGLKEPHVSVRRSRWH